MTKATIFHFYIIIFLKNNMYFCAYQISNTYGSLVRVIKNSVRFAFEPKQNRIKLITFLKL